MDETTHQSTDRRRLLRHGRISRLGASLGVAGVVGVIGFLAAGGIASAGTTATNPTISLHRTKLGLILVTAGGRSVYLFAKDRNGKSACSASCAKFWPPVLSHGKTTGGPGINASMLGTIRRSNGSLQLTYNKHPLYLYALDKAAGQTNGEGSLAFGAHWYAVSGKGAAIIKAATPTNTTPNPYP